MCGRLFDKNECAYRRAIEWSQRPEEYVKRAGFALMAALALHDKNAPDERFLGFLPAVRRESTDDRNFVKKAVIWALRQIDKRSLDINEAAVNTAREIQGIDARSARWIASNALREFGSDKAIERLRSRRPRG